MSQYVVIDRSSRRVRHQSESLEAARAFVEACRRPTCIAIVAEIRSRSEWKFRIEVVNGSTGRVLAQTGEFDFDEVVDEFLDAKLLLVPACLSGNGGAI